tara:strand:- start:6 stop:140 length:135 start_codon:yes stop_codon:yes gene_type:complete
MGEHLSTDLTSHADLFRRAKRREGGSPFSDPSAAFLEKAIRAEQ